MAYIFPLNHPMELSFDMDVAGTATLPSSVLLVLQRESVTVGFAATKQGDRWVANVADIGGMFTPGQVNVSIQVILNNRVFTPMKTVGEVVSDGAVSTTNITMTPVPEKAAPEAPTVHPAEAVEIAVPESIPAVVVPAQAPEAAVAAVAKALPVKNRTIYSRLRPRVAPAPAAEAIVTADKPAMSLMAPAAEAIVTADKPAMSLMAQAEKAYSKTTQTVRPLPEAVTLPKPIVKPAAPALVKISEAPVAPAPRPSAPVVPALDLTGMFSRVAPSNRVKPIALKSFNEGASAVAAQPTISLLKTVEPKSSATTAKPAAPAVVVEAVEKPTFKIKRLKIVSE